MLGRSGVYNLPWGFCKQKMGPRDFDWFLAKRNPTREVNTTKKSQRWICDVAEKTPSLVAFRWNNFPLVDPRYSLHSPKSNIEPENGPLEEEIPFEKAIKSPSFSGSMELWWPMNGPYRWGTVVFSPLLSGSSYFRVTFTGDSIQLNS